MDNLKHKWAEVIGDPLRVYDVTTINHKPHPFTIGPRHLAYASDHCGGMLGKEAARAERCAARKCFLSYDEHTYDTVMFLQLTGDATSAEVQEALLPHLGAIEADGIDGFVFVETQEGFRISQGGHN